MSGYAQRAALLSSVASGSLARRLAGSEPQALSIDFTDSFHWNSQRQQYGSALVRDNGTLANNFDGVPYDLLTYTSPSLKMTMGPDGLLRFGAHNLFTSSELLGATGSTGWTINRVTMTAGQADPFGGTAAVLMTEDGTAANTHRTFANVTQVAGASYGISVYAKQASGSRTLYIRDDADSTTKYAFFTLSGAGSIAADSGVTATITQLSDGWYLCSAAFVNATASANQMFGLASGTSVASATYSGDSTSGIYLARGHMRRTPSDSAYLATTTAARYALPFEWSSAGALQGILVEEARTNLCLYSDDLTNAAWTKSNMTTAKTATGPDGVANSATTCTATAGNATALQSITSGSAARIQSCYIKRRTGTGNIDLTQDNGTTWTTVTVTSSWTRVNVPSATVTNPIVGLRIVTSGDEVDVCLMDQEVGAFVTSPIPTLGATVTRAVDNISLATSAFPLGTDHTLYCKYITGPDVATSSYFVSLNDGTINEFIGLRNTSSNNNAIVVDGGITVANENTTAAVAATTYKTAVAVAANDARACTSGTLSVGDASMTLPTVTRIGWGSGSGIPAGYRYIQQTMYLPRRATDTQLQTMTA